MKNIIIALSFTILIISCANKPTAFNKACPISGDEVDPKISTVEHNGKNYGFCCLDCDKEFKSNPAKFAANLNEDGTDLVARKKIN
ncbi:MAG: hypothetical protein O3A55_01290 [Bacteroidetes bacterium]|nr:hypothetical protein [Bacteroidota bacterium]